MSKRKYGTRLSEAAKNDLQAMFTIADAPENSFDVIADEWSALLQLEIDAWPVRSIDCSRMREALGQRSSEIQLRELVIRKGAKDIGFLVAVVFQDEDSGTDGGAPIHLFELDSDASRHYQEIKNRTKASESFGDAFKFLLQ